MNLASLKRAIATPNVIIRVVSHWQPQLKGTTRIPTKIQTNGYWFDAPDNSGKVARMWAPLPEVTELEFMDDYVVFHPNTARSWTLAFEVNE
jgi:hypothetical protein